MERFKTTSIVLAAMIGFPLLGLAIFYFLLRTGLLFTWIGVVTLAALVGIFIAPFLKGDDEEIGGKVTLITLAVLIALALLAIGNK